MKPSRAKLRHLAATASLAAAWLLSMAPGESVAKTLIITAQGSDRVAAIAEPAPRQSLAMNEVASGVFDTSRVQLAEDRSFLIRFSLQNIPAGQRIAHAELMLPVTELAGNEPRFYLWRLIAPWGAGVCYDDRTAHPKRISWTKPGARGLSSDRATRPTDIVRPTTPGEVTINVTEDVALWYTRSASNEGWIITVEDPQLKVYLTSPLAGPDARNAWKLRITYEPS